LREAALGCADYLAKTKNPIMVAILFAEVLKGKIRKLMIQTALDLENEMSNALDQAHLVGVYYEKDL
jgi:hypothetical protein